MLTIPYSARTAERLFSTLRRLKTYLRSTMRQARLNGVTILHIHSGDSEQLNLDEILDEFIKKNAVRRNNTFAMSN